MITKNILEKLEKTENFEVKIWDITFRVIFDKDHTDTASVFWHINTTRQLIYVQPDIHISKKRNTFIHEVLHGMFFTSWLSYEDWFDTFEEKLCRNLAEHINLFIDNN